jgi:hypothetical protein
MYEHYPLEYLQKEFAKKTEWQKFKHTIGFVYEEQGFIGLVHGLYVWVKLYFMIKLVRFKNKI